MNKNLLIRRHLLLNTIPKINLTILMHTIKILDYLTMTKVFEKYTYMNYMFCNLFTH